MGARMKVSSLTYSSALAWLGTRATKVIAHNTYMRVDAHDLLVIYHKTPVVVLHANGVTQLNSGGYTSSSTTKDRISRLGPMPVWQQKRVWKTPRGDFFDGIAYFPGVLSIPVTGTERALSVAALYGDTVALAALYDYLAERASAA